MNSQHQLQVPQSEQRNTVIPFAVAKKYPPECNYTRLGYESDADSFRFYS